MIKLIERSFLNTSKYNRCIMMDEKGLPYGYSWYLDALCDQWQVLVLNDYDAVWPFAVTSKYGFKYAYRPVGVQQLGISSLKTLTNIQIQEFTEALSKHFRFADLFLNEGQIPVSKSPKMQVFPRTNMLLDVSQSYESMYGNFRKELRKKIRRIERNKSLELFENDGPAVLLNMFKETKGAKIQLEPNFYVNMEQAMYQWLHHGMGKLWTAYDKHNQPMAAIFVVETENRSIFFSSALANEGRSHEANIFLLNEYLINIAEKKQYFDFEGTEDPGLAVFNKSWGVEVYPYYRLWYNNLPWPINKLKNP